MQFPGNYQNGYQQQPDNEEPLPHQFLAQRWHFPRQGHAPHAAPYQSPPRHPSPDMHGRRYGPDPYGRESESPVYQYTTPPISPVRTPTLPIGDFHGVLDPESGVTVMYTYGIAIRKRVCHTIEDSQPFIADIDAKLMRKAIGRKNHPNLDLVIHLLCQRSSAQRLLIRRSYAKLYRENLAEDIVRLTHFNLEAFTYALLVPRADYIVMQIHDCLRGLGVDEMRLIGILGTASAWDLDSMRRHYYEIYGKDMVECFAELSTCKSKHILVALMCARRPDFGIDKDTVHKIANRFLQFPVVAWFDTDNFFLQVFSCLSFDSLRYLIQVLEQAYQMTLEEKVQQDFMADYKPVILALIMVVKSPPAFFAWRLYKGIKNVIPHDQSIIPIIVFRSEIDLKLIKEAFHARYNNTVANMLSRSVGGYFRQGLCELLHGNL